MIGFKPVYEIDPWFLLINKGCVSKDGEDLLSASRLLGVIIMKSEFVIKTYKCLVLAIHFITDDNVQRHFL